MNNISLITPIFDKVGIINKIPTSKPLSRKKSIYKVSRGWLRRCKSYALQWIWPGIYKKNNQKNWVYLNEILNNSKPKYKNKMKKTE